MTSIDFAPRTHRALALGVFALTLWSGTARPQESPGGDAEDFRVTSTTFTNHATLPLSAVDNIMIANVNVCTADGSAGGNTSPELSWSHAPRHTRSFVVVTYDTTAAFTHWGIYNIAGDARGLPSNAGAPGSAFGGQVVNDFGHVGYEGPCPPANFPPNVHHYVFTVYALDTSLQLPASTNFAANAETLYHALIAAAREGHILASASITGLFSSTP
jgi:Raf kinase inhibitor-like YbhB/YbcL family protein